ncbi:MAG: PAS domain S-box protein [Desulfocapsaceae bacterium]|nr:PAS domain S-box protein [Desulfocapsaceae bacterium]
MKSQRVNSVHSRVAYKLTSWIILLSVIITLLTSFIQLYFAYQKDLEGIENYFQSVTNMQLRSISQSVWIMDESQVQTHLDGIIKARDIVHASVFDDQKTLWQSGSKDADETITFVYPLNYLHRGALHNLGTLQIVASLDKLHERLRSTAMVIFFTNGLEIFVLAAFILILLHVKVTRHLEKLASHIVKIDFRTKSRPLKLKRGIIDDEDEFSQIAEMLNILQRRGFNAFRALRNSESRLRLFFDATEEGIFGFNSEGRITFANSSCLSTIGAKRDSEIIGRKVTEVFSYVSSSDFSIQDGENMFLDPLDKLKPLASDDGLLKVKNGRSFFANIRTYPVISKKHSSGAVVFFNDISEKREMEKERRLLSQAIRQSPLLVIISDSIGRIEYVNPGFEKLTGFSLQQVMGKKIYFLGHHTRNRAVYRDIQGALLQGRKWQGGYHIRGADGVEYRFDALVSPVMNEQGNIVNIIALCLDITQKVALQEQLFHAQKMEAVGRLSASFAHEFGNPLLGVRSVIKDISERVVMGADDRQLMQLAYEECERMKLLIRDFQGFQSSNSDEKSYENIHLILDNVLLFYKKHFENNNITLRKSYQSDLPFLLVSKNQISQVFLNLIINAVDAMTDGGGSLEVITYAQANHVHISLRDTGIGITEIEKELIFEPFYTTKSEIEGSGLGLSVSYGIVAGHGGDIHVSSLENEGATFTVKLPLKPFKN